MNPEPRHRDEYTERQTEAARRVLIDVGQVLASFADCLVVIGGWAPDLLLVDAEEPHIGSMDVDLALDVEKLSHGRYAELVKLLLDTRRYRRGEKEFQLVVDVDLKDGEKPVVVGVEFLAPKGARFKKNKPKLLAEFRFQEADGCAAAFHKPVTLKIPGRNVLGAKNTVLLQVASIADFLVMKAHAIGGRDKPKDIYDLCYCLEQYPGGMREIAVNWNQRLMERDVTKAIEILREKFASIEAFGPQQLVEFYFASDEETRLMHARRAYELVQKFLSLI